jgi:hypothetical protein
MFDNPEMILGCFVILTSSTALGFVYYLWLR